MSAMYDPPHPGEVLREEFLKPLGLSVTRAAEMLGVSRKTLSQIVNCRVGISPEMAIRLEMAFKPSAESWLRHQAAWDLWQSRKRIDFHIPPFTPSPARSGVPAGNGR